MSIFEIFGQNEIYEIGQVLNDFSICLHWSNEILFFFNSEIEEQNWTAKLHYFNF